MVEEAVAEAPAAAEGLQGYAVTVELAEGPREHFLIAGNIVLAAELAARVGRVSRVTHLGPALV